MDRTLATGQGLLDAGNVFFKATFLLRKIVALVAILWFTGWLQETICFVLHYLLLTIRMIPFHQSSREKPLCIRVAEVHWNQDTVVSFPVILHIPYSREH